MNINEASDFFKLLISETDEKSKIRVYEKFIDILSDLKNRNLTKEQLRSIEEELDVLKLNMNPTNKQKHPQQKLNHFLKYLKGTFSLITKGYYTKMGIPLGLTAGIVFGIKSGIANGTTWGLVFGMLAGLLIGRIKDSEAEKQNRVLNIELL